MCKRIALFTLILLLPVLAFAMMQLPDDEFEKQIPENSISRLQARIDNGELKLDFDGDHGYLKALLKALNVPASSQMLVFSKTSVQKNLISPKNPRALYFNDSTYIGWIPGAPIIEAVTVDSKLGPTFYTLRQQKSDRPAFKREGENCASCHGRPPVAKLFMLSVFTDSLGNAYGGTTGTEFGQLGQLWGGWYVTGTHGGMDHLGNITPIPDDFTGDLANPVGRIRLGSGENVTDLSKRLDIKRYLQPGSDIVALIVHRNQITVHNAMTSAISMAAARPVAEAAEPFVRALFSGGVPFTSPIRGTSSFANEFANAGPHDSRGRSLRDLDLDHRLFRYPLSYIIYSEEFNAMPQPLKERVYTRMREVLSGADQSPQFASISKSDREAILEILRETKADFAAN